MFCAAAATLTDEAVCARYLDSPYAQLFCSEAFFQHTLPLDRSIARSLDRSSLTRWRQRIGAERREVLLAESLAVAQRNGAMEDKHLRRVTIDTTVQPKAVTHPTDSKLLHCGIEILARLARRHGIRLRQSYRRVAAMTGLGRGIMPEILAKRTHGAQHSVNRRLYALWSRIERLINKLKKLSRGHALRPHGCQLPRLRASRLDPAPPTGLSEPPGALAAAGSGPPGSCGYAFARAIVSFTQQPPNNRQAMRAVPFQLSGMRPCGPPSHSGWMQAFSRRRG